MLRTLRPAALRGSLAALALALALPNAALATGGGTDPVTNPPVYPGTSTPVNGWQSVGILRRPPALDDTGWGASAVLVAPRIVLASGHAAGEPGGTFTTPTGDRAVFQIGGIQPKQRRLDPIEDVTGTADISVMLLDRPLPAPPGGFPLLLKDRVTLDLISSLPGYSLWDGRGGTGVKGQTVAGWARNDGKSMAGYPSLGNVDGDSGSTHFLYTSPTARPIMPGITVKENYDLVFGGLMGPQVTFGEALQPSPTENFATVGDWLSAQIDGLVAEHPGLERPTFVTLAQAGIDVRTLRPSAPRDLKLVAQSNTSVKLTWSHPADTRIPRLGYYVYDSARPNTRYSVSDPTITLSGLDPQVSHRITVRAFNMNGESPVARAARQNGATIVGSDEPDAHTYMQAVSGLTVTTERARSVTPSGQATDYCATAAWQEPTAPSGATVDSYRVSLGGAVLVTGLDLARTFDKLADGRLSYRHCGLSPAEAQTFTVNAVSGQVFGAPATATATTPTGAPRGTPLTAATVTVTPRRAAAAGKVDYCADISLTPPTPVDGFPVSDYSVLLRSSNYSFQRSVLVPAGTNRTSICGLEQGTDYPVNVYTNYGDLGSVLARFVTAEIPFGPVNGTPLPLAKGITVTEQRNIFLQRCLKVTWTPATSLDGFPARSQNLIITAPTGTKLASYTGVAMTATTVTACGARALTKYTVAVQTTVGLDAGAPAVTETTATITTRA